MSRSDVESQRIMTKSTTNQLGLAPMRMPKRRASWIDPPTTPSSQARGRYGAGVWRATIVSTSAPAGSVPYSRPCVAGEAGGAEGVGDRGRRVAHEQRALQREREALDDPPRAVLELRAVAQLGAHALDEGVQARVGARGEVDLGLEELERLRVARRARAGRRGP